MAGSAWNTFTPGTKARSSQVNENFEWSNQHIVPHSGASKVDNTYDLGESGYQFRNGYVKGTLYVAGDDIKTWAAAVALLNG